MSLNTDSTRQQLDVPARFADAQPVSELPGRGQLCCLARHPGGDEVVGAGLDVELHFLIEGAIDGRRPEHVCHSRQPGHQFPLSYALGVLENVVYRTGRGTPSLFFEAELTAPFGRDFTPARGGYVQS